VLRIALGVYLVRQTRWPLQKKAKEFYKYSHELSEQLSQPSIMFKARLNNGKEIMLDDYREAYWWLKKTTPEDARVMAWWDYGYQIAGIGNRTTIADGNTWNHEHIATLGRILSASEEKAHRIARHLADYVLVWAGGGGDDLAKSPHMARIGNSVYHDICDEPTCSQVCLRRRCHSRNAAMVHVCCRCCRFCRCCRRCRCRCCRAHARTLAACCERPGPAELKY
jgi:dolichyl-diphosphooligosaccharide--protein glycosyltransferase